VAMAEPAAIAEPAAMAEAPVWPNHAQSTAGSISTSTTGAASEPSRVVTIDSEETYVLQVGAFIEPVSAERAVRKIGLEELRIIATRRDGHDWYVLVLGAYHSREDAREAGEAYLNAYPKGSIWVRAAADLKQSLIDP
ncbi:MAG: SPOR domain-containing protein, partial [Gammaproteobacteria bacterium]|nr:SPOR domain-containing protein [Gammaproteobacteria bacterium]